MPEIRYSIELDIAYDEDTVQEAIEHTTGQAGGEWETTVTDQEGPAGGWPVVRFATFNREAMGELIKQYANGDMRDAFEFALDVEKELVP